MHGLETFRSLCFPHQRADAKKTPHGFGTSNATAYGATMPDFDYRQRATTPEYRENWDRIFKKPAAAPSPLDVRCGWCGAKPGEECQGMFGNMPVGRFHALRFGVWSHNNG
jgi:hypothetical protein